jgi:hypothetical protein
MAGENDHPPPGSDRTLDVLEAVRLNAPARLKDAEFLEMRVFGRDASEVVPHAGDDARDLGLGQLGKGAAKIKPSPLRNAEMRPDATRQRAAEGGCTIEREQAKDRD